MTLLFFRRPTSTLPKEKAHVAPSVKKVLTMQEAKMALASDKLGVVWRTTKEVVVVTAYGAGRFEAKEWDRQ